MQNLRIIRNLLCPVRDGTNLACDLYRPDNDEKLPTILMRTPYIKEHFSDEWLYSDYAALAESGYNVLIQDVRGCGASEGILLSSGGNEVEDGYDSVEWAAAQPWCNGVVGMYGLSYFGFTQMAAAQDNPPHLKAICPFQNGSLYPLSMTSANTLGCYHLMWLYDRVLARLDQYPLSDEEKQKVRDSIHYYQEHWNEIILQLPLIETKAARIEGAPVLLDYIDLINGVEDDAFLKSARRPIALKNIDVPMFLLSGWFDAAKDGTFENYDEIMKNGTETARTKSRLMIGPWQHGGMLVSSIEDKDFGPENSGQGHGVQEAVRQWFDHWLKNKEISQYPPVSIFVLGINKWRDEEEWPPKRACIKKYYLEAGKDKNSGLLKSSLPEGKPSSHYVYDPGDPLPSMYTDGKGHMVFADPAAMEQREDVLVFSSSPFTSPVEVTGYVTLVLYASTDCTDTDFYCKLSDTSPDGSSFPLIHGIVRARFRHGRKAEPLIPGNVYCFEIKLGAISNVFLEGHSLRIDLSSSSFPEYDRNLNTGERTGYGTDFVKASQTIFHSTEYPSHLLLPVIS